MIVASCWWKLEPGEPFTIRVTPNKGVSDHRRKLPGPRLHHSGLHLGVQVEDHELAEELTQVLSEPGKVEAVPSSTQQKARQTSTSRRPSQVKQLFTIAAWKQSPGATVPRDWSRQWSVR